MQIATSKTREQFPLSPKKIIKKTVASTFLYTIVLILIWISFVGLRIFYKAGIEGFFSITVVFILLFLIVVIPTYFYQKWYFATYFYDLTDDYIIIKKGPITPYEITIPYERVQDVYVDQDLLDRFFGLYDVHLSSATYSSGAAAHIDGVEKAAADGLRVFLLKTVQQKIGRNHPAPNTPNNINQK